MTIKKVKCIRNYQVSNKKTQLFLDGCFFRSYFLIYYTVQTVLSQQSSPRPTNSRCRRHRRILSSLILCLRAIYFYELSHRVQRRLSIYKRLIFPKMLLHSESGIATTLYLAAYARIE